MIDEAPKAKWYYSDGFDAYQWLWYHLGRYEVSDGKADTFSVEGDMLNSVIIWLASLAGRVTFLVAHMRWSVLCAFLFIVSMPDNFSHSLGSRLHCVSLGSPSHS
jgi:hypothetical protein